MDEAVVRISVAPVLAARSVVSEQVTQALLGAPVTLLERQGRWARIRMEDGYEGWISTGHLVGERHSAPEWVTVTDLWVNLRPRPDYRMPARTVAFVGTRLPLRERREGWLGLALPAGGLGWLEETRGLVHTAHHRLPRPRPEELVATARRFLGVPYLWGGCTPLGLDCSGFVQLVYRLHGVLLHRDAHQQALQGAPVPLRGADPGSLAALAPGDAVYFCSAGDPARISHVGLAVDRERFIHAAGSDRVRIDTWLDSSYATRLVCARRYLSGDCQHGVRSEATPGAASPLP